MIKISPSLLSCDFGKMGEELRRIKNAGADFAHLDVMDGKFVNNISFGIPVIAGIRKESDIFFDVHLMIEEPIHYVSRFAQAGADLITFHLEAANDVAATIAAIKSTGKKVGLSIKPKTPASAVFPYLDMCDLILVMTVEPGFGGQSLIPETLDKVKTIREEMSRRGIDAYLEVDGGINENNASLARDAGADVLVAGSAVFRSSDIAATIKALRG
ncbi:MAG: ribulose-phosphate 3-epimerase [Eubacteriales bacterium]|nr:ribulose-phosphate 3-epimerase [Eubacteriales bacterium]